MNMFKSKSDVSEDDDSKDFIEYLKEAQETDLSDLERTGCVSQGRDMRNNHVIIMIPSLGLNKIERPEAIFRKMLLLFLLKTHEMVGTSYSVVYAHTAIDLINQYPLIYKFYSILPRSYKKNLKKMYIVHPNIGIRAFFEFARIFLSHKFYNKLCLLENVIDFQRIIYPTQLPLPLKFLRREDEERDIRYSGPLPSVRQSYNNNMGTMEILYYCAEFLKETNGIQSPGIFRVPGDEGEISLAKSRLQFGYSAKDPENSWVALSENRRYIVIGDLNALYVGNSGQNSPIGTAPLPSPPSSSSTASVAAPSAAAAAAAAVASSTSGTTSGSNSAHTSLNVRQVLRQAESAATGTANTIPTSAENSPQKPSHGLPHTNSSGGNNSSMYNFAATGEEQTSTTASDIAYSIVILSNTYTVAELFKLSIRELPEPLVPEDLTKDLLQFTRAYGSRPLDWAWEQAVAQRLADLPLSNLSTLIFIVRFLRTVGAEAHANNMNTKNLSLVFAPTIFRFEMTDLVAATMDVKLIQSVMREIMERPSLLHHTVKCFRELYTTGKQQQQQLLQGRTNSNSSHSGSILSMDASTVPIDYAEIEHLIASNPMFSSPEFKKVLEELDLSQAQKADLANISSGLSPAMVARMHRGNKVTRRGSQSSSQDYEETGFSSPMVLPERLDEDDDETLDPTESAAFSAKERRKVQMKERAVEVAPVQQLHLPGRSLPVPTAMDTRETYREEDEEDEANDTFEDSNLGDEARAAVALSGHVDPATLTLLDDLKLIDGSETR